MAAAITLTRNQGNKISQRRDAAPVVGRMVRGGPRHVRIRQESQQKDDHADGENLRPSQQDLTALPHQKTKGRAQKNNGLMIRERQAADKKRRYQSSSSLRSLMPNDEQVNQYAGQQVVEREDLSD